MRSTSRWLVAALAGIALLAIASPARAQDYEAAGRHFQAAQDAFGKGEFRKAADEYEEAYKITKDPILLYNIGDAWEQKLKKGDAKAKPKEKKADAEKAVDYLHRYVTDAPTAEDRPAVEKRIAELEKEHGVKAPATVVAATPLVDKAAAEKAAAEKAAAEKAAADRMAAEKAMADKKVADDKAAAEARIADEKAAAEKRIADEKAGLTKKMGDEKSRLEPSFGDPTPAATTPPETLPPAPMPAGLLDDDKATPLKTGAWIGTAVTVALVTAGAIFGLAAQSRSDEVGRQLVAVDSMTMQPPEFDQTHQNTLKGLHDDGQTYNTVAIALLATAGVAAVVSGVLFYLDHRNHTAEPAHARVLPSLRPGMIDAEVPAHAGLEN